MFELFAEASIDIDHAIFWGAIVLICVLPSLGYYVYKWRKTEIEAELKHEMIARGMSADEIERVLKARLGQPTEAEKLPERRQMDITQPFDGR